MGDALSTLHEAAAACCAHLRVHWAETKHPDGTISGRWLCTLCGAEFRNSPGIEPLTPMAEALAEAQRQADTTTAQLERSVEELGASVDRVIAENEALQDELARARADRDTAANVDRQLRARVDELEAARTDALLFSHESMWRDVLDWMEADLANLGPGPAGGREGRVKHVRQALERAALRDAAFEQAKAENAALLNAFPEYGKTGNELREERARTEAVRAVLRRNGFRVQLRLVARAAEPPRREGRGGTRRRP